MEKPFGQLLDALGEGCPICALQPLGVQVYGPNAITLEPCGHTFNAQQWLDDQYQGH